MTRNSTDTESKPSKEDVGGGRDITSNLNADTILETLRNKLENSHGECIYKLSDPCKYIGHSLMT